jgi:hypothetical protein
MSVRPRSWRSRPSTRPPIRRLGPDVHKKDPAQAREFLTDYCLNNATAVIDAWWKLGDDLLVMYNHLWIYDAKTRKQHRKFPTGSSSSLNTTSHLQAPEKTA